MMERQSETGGFLPEKVVTVVDHMDVEDILKLGGEEKSKELKYQSTAICPLSLGNCKFDVVADLTSPKPAVPLVARVDFNLPTSLPTAYTTGNQRHMSLQFMPCLLCSVLTVNPSRCRG